MISELNENKLLKTKEHLKVILGEGFGIIDENKSIFNVYHSLFRRYMYCLESVKILIADFSVERKFREQSIAIVLRASLLDYLTTLYLSTFQAEHKIDGVSKSPYEIELEKLMSEQLRRILTVSEIDKKTPAYNHESFCSFVDSMREKFNDLFDETQILDYHKPFNSLRYKRKDDISPSVIRKRLDSLSHRFSGIDYLHTFSLYDIYSKYDHFGIMSMFLENMEIDEICDNMLWSIFHITDGIGFCIDLLKDEVGCNSDFEKLLYEISLLRGIVYTKTLYLSPEYKASLQ